MCPRLVLYLHEYYRVVTSALFHGNLMHIGMNMLSTFHLSAMLEKRLGTLPHLMTTMGAILCTSGVYLLVSWVASLLCGYDAWMYQHSVGFSGVLFHFCVLECHLISSGPRSLFGVIHVPPQWYPWALLILLQLFLPNLSFLGHLSGILTGTLHYYGVLSVITIGRDVDEWVVGAGSGTCTATSLTRLPLPGFVPATETRTFQDPSALFHAIGSGYKTLRRMIGYVLEVFIVCIFGRGHRLNSNARLWTLFPTTTSSGGPMSGCALEDDEEWGGLPTISSLVVETDSKQTSQVV